MPINLMKDPVTGEPVIGIETRVGDIQSFRPTVEQVRDMILRSLITTTDWSRVFPLDPEYRKFIVTQREIEAVSTLALEAVRYGRMIDFGYLPNDVMKEGGNRGGPVWNAGGFGQPFSEPWVMYHGWEGGISVYLVNPGEDHRFEVVELQPTRTGPDRMLMINDRAMFFRVPGDLPKNKYHCAVSPSTLRFLADPEANAQINNGGSPGTAAGGNTGDPVMAGLMILNTRNVERVTIEADAKLQRARKKSGKPPIPSYQRIDTGPYVTAIMARGKARPKGEDQGGHHASPVPHIRMGHPRTYASGRTIFVRDTLVNVTDDNRAEFLRTRSHYEVQR